MTLLTFQRQFWAFLLGDYPSLAAAAAWVNSHCGLSPRPPCLCLQFVLLWESWEREFFFILKNIRWASDWTLIHVWKWKAKACSIILNVTTICVSATNVWQHGPAIVAVGGAGYHSTGEVVSLQNHTAGLVFSLFAFFLIPFQGNDFFRQ